MASENSSWRISTVVGLSTLAFLSLCLIFLRLSAAPVPLSPAGTIAIVGGQLIDGHGSTPVHRSVVIIEGSKIKTVGREGEIAIPAGAKVIDAHGMTVMPGLIEMHAHLVLLGEGTPYDNWIWGNKWAGGDRTLEFMRIAAREFLMNGVTTVRDVGGDTKISVNFRDAIKEGKEVGPRLFVTGAFIARNCSYANPTFCTQINSPEEAAEAARQRLAAGVDWVKSWIGMQPADIRAVAEVAHQAGKHVALHWVGADVQDYGLNSGDTLEHWQALTPQVLDNIAKTGAWVVPTLMQSWVYELTEEFPERVDDQQFKKDYPPDLYAMMHDPSVTFQRLDYFAGIYPRLHVQQDTMHQMVNSRFAGRLLVGTDAGTALNFNTNTTRGEMALFTKWGVSPLDTISAATRLPAQALGKSAEFGTIDPGKFADIIVIDGDPLENMGDLKNVVHVFKEGTQYK
jgi:imidazolonepropionase-like amidohydrolase